MGNVLDTNRQQQLVALGRLGWPLRRIERETGVRRETASAYLKAAGIAVSGRGRPGEGKGKPAISGEVSTDSPPAPWPAPPTRAPQASACEPHRDRIDAALKLGRNAMAIWQDLVEDGFTARYASVRRFVLHLRGATPAEARVVIATAPGDDCDFVSRFFAPKVGIGEDPVTGSTHCYLIPFWAERLGKQTLVARQLSKRGGELFCENGKDRVRIGGHAVTYLTGEIEVPNNV